jgi:hypothetical protein
MVSFIRDPIGLSGAAVLVFLIVYAAIRALAHRH